MKNLLLIHGWGMNAAVWKPVIDALSSDFQLHLLELPGHGHCTRQTGEHLEDWAASVLLRAPPKGHWLGWSLGGQLAMQAALQAPERVESLLLTATAPRFIQGADWPHAMPEGTLGQFADSLNADYQATLGRFLALQVRGGEHGRQLLRSLKKELASRPEADPEALAAGLRLLRGTDLRSQLLDIQCPLSWSFGERDNLIPIAVADDLAALLPGAAITRITGAAHAPFLSHPEPWLAWLRRALS